MKTLSPSSFLLPLKRHHSQAFKPLYQSIEIFKVKIQIFSNKAPKVQFQFLKNNL